MQADCKKSLAENENLFSNAAVPSLKPMQAATNQKHPFTIDMIKNSLIPHQRRSQRGLTLIELLVVLFVVAATAGIAVGILPNFQKKAHGSTSAASIRGAESSITAALLTNGELGDFFDGLITDAGAIPAFVGNANGFVAETLDATEAGALNELGITEVYAALTEVALGEGNATFEGHDYDTPTTIPVADTEILASLTAAARAEVADSFNLESTPTIVFAFGLGEESTLVGLNRAFKEAPVHTPGEGSVATTYCRYAVLVGYDATEEEAFYIGITCIDDGEEFKNIQGNLGEFYEND